MSAKVGDEGEVYRRKVSAIGEKTRFIILAISLICVTINQMNSLTFNFSVICMDDLVNSTEDGSSHWIEDASSVSVLFSATGIGAFIGLLPSVPLISIFGVRTILTISGIFSAVGTIFFPLAVDLSFIAAVICRVFQGLGTSVIFTVIGIIPVYWSPFNEMGTFLAILSCAMQLSNIVCMPVSGLLCESSLGWRSIYYVFGAATIIAYAAFAYFYRDSPSHHRHVSSRELDVIQMGKGEQKRESVPYAKVVVDPTIIVSWVSAFGGHVGFFLLILYGPTYLREVLNFDVRSTGFASAFPYVLSAAVKTVAGPVSDKATFISEKIRFTLCAVLSQFGMAACLIVMAMTSSASLAQIAYTLSIAASGLNVMGVIKCCQIRSGQHVHFVIAFISLCVCVIQFVAPIVVGILCPDNSPEQWSRLIIIVAIVVIITNVPFPFFAKDVPAEFTQPRQSKKNSNIVV